MFPPNRRNTYYIFFLVLLTLGGIEGQNLYFIWTVTFAVSIALLFQYFRLGKLLLPPSFKYYLAFIGFLVISITWSADPITTVKHSLNLVSAGLMWLLIHNEKNDKDLPDIGNLTTILGITFGFLFIYNKVRGIYNVESYNLISYSVQNLTHHHAGDLMAVVLPVLLYKLQSKNNPIFTIPILISFYALIFSFSRSSYVALGMALLFLVGKTKPGLVRHLLILLATVGVIVLTLGVASQKGLISHRLFYLQTIPGVINNPLGVGLGNFSKISLDPRNHILGIDDYAGVADNIFLEMFAGMGILGFSFLYWIYTLTENVLKSSKNKDPNAFLVVISLFCNFQFNYVYLIPTFFWLFIIGVGLLLRKRSNKNSA